MSHLKRYCNSCNSEVEFISEWQYYYWHCHSCDEYLDREDVHPFREPIKVGQRIVFKSACRDGYKKAIRKIVGFSRFGYPLVRYNGWDNFVILPKEIIEILD